MTVLGERAYNTSSSESTNVSLKLTIEERPNNRPCVAIETHGCKLNQADSGLLSRQFVQAGFRLVSGDEPADVYVVNSCTVTHVADRKARHALRAARRRNPKATIVATGCYAERAPERIRQLEEVDLVLGNTDKATLVRRVMDWRGGTPIPCAVGEDGEVSTPRICRTRAMVKIQEGCNQVCAYCIVPKVRGRERSITSEAIIAEINRYVALGYKEAVLTGTQLGSYGFDLSGVDLARLLERILQETDIVRLRVSSLQPQEITEEMLSLWSDLRLSPHFHLPLQSGSDAVLKRMRRRYTAELYADSVDTIRRSVSDVSITADVVVGFPAESHDQFMETYSMCQRIGFASAHVFQYSVRPGTSAAHFDGQVSPTVKADRAYKLLQLAETQATDFRARFLSDVRPVLWEETREIDGSIYWSGLTDNYIRVVGKSARPLANQVTLARLDAQKEDLVYVQVL